MTRPPPRQPPSDPFGVAGLAPALAAAVRHLATTGFHALWSGDSFWPADLTDGRLAGEAMAHLLSRGRVEVSDDGRVTGLHGLSLRQTPHRINHDRGHIHTWCAIDAVGIPAALGIDARAVTHCPSCGREVTVAIAAGVPLQPREAVLWHPDWSVAHLRNEFCSAANLFCSPGHLQRWAAGRSGAGVLMTIDDAAALGRNLWADVSGMDDSRA